MNKFLLGAGAALMFAACAATDDSSSSSATAATVVDAGQWDQYGAGTDIAATTVAVDDVLANPAAFDGKTMRLSGPIVGTCAQKGCWMRLGSAGDNVFVKFKDYGFFVPTGGVEGQHAVVDGQLSVTEQSVEEVKHYLEDAGKHDEAAKVTEPRTVVSFMATGVAIKKPE